jgi:ribosomal protein S18 acetylase RimI-like enzyme
MESTHDPRRILIHGASSTEKSFQTMRAQILLALSQKNSSLNPSGIDPNYLFTLNSFTQLENDPDAFLVIATATQPETKMLKILANKLHTFHQFYPILGFAIGTRVDWFTTNAKNLETEMIIGENNDLGTQKGNGKGKGKGNGKGNGKGKGKGKGKVKPKQLHSAFEIELFCVDSNHHRQGIGRKLEEFMHLHAKSKKLDISLQSVLCKPNVINKDLFLLRGGKIGMQPVSSVEFWKKMGYVEDLEDSKWKTNDKVGVVWMKKLYEE